MRFPSPKWLLIVVFLVVSSGALALSPAKEYDVIPDTMGVPFQKNTILTEDNYHLNSWTFLPGKKKNNKTTLVLAYADAGNMSWWVQQAKTFAAQGYTVVMFDYRGFGKSDPFVIDPTMLYYTEFSRDLAAMVKFAKNKYVGNKTGVWCLSMGTIVTTLAAREAQPDFIIGDSYVTDLKSIQQYYKGQKQPVKLPNGGADYPALLAAIKVPMLLFSGKDDPITPFSTILKLRDSKPAIKIFGYNANHMEGFGVLSSQYPGSDYIKAVNTFLKIK